MNPVFIPQVLRKNSFTGTFTGTLLTIRARVGLRPLIGVTYELYGGVQAMMYAANLVMCGE